MSTSVQACACAGAPKPGRKAAGVDADIQASNLRRLRRVEGQVRGLQKMVAEQRYCADILVQLSAVQEALRAVGRELLRNHLKHCATQALRSPSAGERQAMYDELVELFDRHAR
jgi:CsoR family transcriptional regulator, copper-sensing transcriptional repressor